MDVVCPGLRLRNRGSENLGGRIQGNLNLRRSWLWHGAAGDFQVRQQGGGKRRGHPHVAPTRHGELIDQVLAGADRAAERLTERQNRDVACQRRRNAEVVGATDFGNLQSRVDQNNDLVRSDQNSRHRSRQGSRIAGTGRKQARMVNSAEQNCRRIDRAAGRQVDRILPGPAGAAGPLICDLPVNLRGLAR